MTDNDYVKVTFEEFSIGSLFYSNGDLCVKTDEKHYLRIFSNRDATVLRKWNEDEDFESANVIEFQYSFLKKSGEEK